MGSASVIPLEAKHHKIVSGGRRPASGASRHVRWSFLNWDTSITVVSDEEIEDDGGECEEQTEGGTGFLRPESPLLNGAFKVPS